MLKVAIIHRRLAHYRVPLYGKIIKNNPDISLSVYCGHVRNASKQSGIPVSFNNLDYVMRVKCFNLGPFMIQPAAIWYALKNRYDVLVCEASLPLLSSIMIMILRRVVGLRNILWLKGWPNDHLDRKFLRMIRRTFLSLAHAYIVYGEHSKENLITYGIPENKITIAQNTINTDRLLSRTRGARKKGPNNQLIQKLVSLNCPYVFNIGRLESKKRNSDLLYAFAILQKEIEVALVIGGMGSELEALKKLAIELDLKQCYFIGSISDNDADELFFHSACCVFPGAVGLALNQAMAGGKVAICADELGPDSELLVHKFNGIRYKRGDINQLAGYLKEILEDRELRDTLGTSARLTIKQKATINNMANKYTSAIRLAVQNKG